MTFFKDGPQVPPPSDLTLGMVCIDKKVPGISVWEMLASERFLNPVGIMQGGFIAAFADSAMGAATITFARGRKVKSANAEMKISFMAPVNAGSKLTCKAEVVKGGKRVVFVEAEILSEGSLIAKASSTYILIER